MKRILILNSDGFPDRYSQLTTPVPTGITKQAYAEKKILKALNTYYSKISVSEIEYLNMQTQFSQVQNSVNSGVVIEEFEIKPSQSTMYTRNGCYVYNNGTSFICRRIILYIYITDLVEGARDSFISQTVFPTLLDYAKLYLNSPSYCIADHKFCIINFTERAITAPIILKNFATLYAAGMDYIEVFDNSAFNYHSVKKDLFDFHEKFSSDFQTNYNQTTKIYDGKCYSINFNDRCLTWKTDYLSSKLTRIGGKLDFSGSSEKFYWIDTLPVSIFAYNLGYKIDYSNFVNFYNTNKLLFKSTSGKIVRCETLIKYMDKYTKEN